MNLLYIEPHGDDALINCFRVLKTPNIHKVLTFTERSSKNLEKYFGMITTEYYDHPDHQKGFKITNYHEARKWKQQGFNVYSNCFEKYWNLWSEDVKELYKYNGSVLEKLDESGDADWADFIFIPLGVLHVYHMTIADAFLDGIFTSKYADKIVFYVEQPYISSATGRMIYEDAAKYIEFLHETKTKEYVIKHRPEDFEKKVKIFSDVYPTELSLFRFTRDQIMANDEIFIKFNLNNLNSFEYLINVEAAR